MAVGQLSIRVGASVDRSLGVAFRPLVEGAQRAKTAIEAESKKAGRAISTETRKGTQDAEARFRALEQEIMTGMPKATNAGVAAVKHFANEAKMNLNNTKKSFADLARDAEASMKRIEHAQSKAAARGNAGRIFDAAGGMGGVKAGLSRGGRMAMGVARAGIGAAAGLGMSLAHGLGVNTDLGSVFHKNAELEQNAVGLSNASVIKGDPRNGTRVDPRELMSQVMETSAKTGTDANATMEGLRKFVDLTGDLKLGREVLMDLEMLAKATGTSMEDMVAAGGEIALALGETEGKAGKITHLMKQFAGQGEMGAISIRSLASNMAKIASSAGQFEGKREDNIAFLGVMGQEARRGGGANSAAMAATAVASFVNTLKTPARAKAFQEATGKSVFNKETGMIRDPQTLIMEALRSSGMEPLAFKKIFANVKGAQGPEALATIYRQAGGGAAGEAAVTKELERLKGALIDDEQILTSFHAAMRTGESQANVFNNKIRETAMQLQTSLTPALVALSPALLQMAKSTASVIEWMVGKEALLKQEDEKTRQQTGEAVTATRKQLGKGEITEEQLAINKIAERDARENAIKQQGGAEMAETKAPKGLEAGFLKAMDYTLLGALSNWVMGSSGADSVEAGKAKVEEKQKVADAAKAQYEELRGVNEEVANLLKSHTINVRVVSPIPGGVVPPGTGDGRTDSPEAAAAKE